MTFTKIVTKWGLGRALAAAVAVAFTFTAYAAVAGEDIEYRIARGGKLYTKWTKEADGYPPRKKHPKYPGEKTKASWLCVSCHGVDYNGRHGIKGITGAVGKAPDEVVAILKDDNHLYTDQMLSDKDMEDLALFVTKGQIDMAKAINPKTKEISGNISKGEIYYNALCAGCHGLDGKKESGMPPVGQISYEDPWSALHIMRNGMPGEGMLALRALQGNVSLDILSYAITLPR